MRLDITTITFHNIKYLMGIIYLTMQFSICLKHYYLYNRNEKRNALIDILN